MKKIQTVKPSDRRASAGGNRHLCLAALLGATALTSATPALAQAGAEEERSNEIIVTAQRRSESLEDVPMTVAVISQDTLSSVGVTSARDLANVTTGFQIGNGGSYPQPAIRGITTINAGAYENNVAVFVDGLYQTSPQILNMELPNVQDIQILKGPQGTLYGRNATGGAILINTVEPGDTLTGSVEATYAKFNDRRGRVFIAGPVTDKIGLSIAGTIRRTDGYYKIASRTTPGQFEGRGLGLKQESVRAKLTFELTEAFRATLAYNYARASDPRGVVFTPIENVTNSYAVPGRNTRARGLGEVSGDIFNIDFTQNEGALKLEFDTGIGTLRSVTGYTRGVSDTKFDFNGTYVPDLYNATVIIDKTWQQSVDFTVDKIDNLNLIVGGTYYNIKTSYDPTELSRTFLGPASLTPFTYPDPATTTVPLGDYKKLNENNAFRTKKAWAVFADATFQATDQLSINVGGRYSNETQDVSGYKVNFNTATGVPRSCPYSISGETQSGLTCTKPSARGSKYNKFTPRASIRYEIAPNTNVYASYSKGFRGGEWNLAIPSDNPDLWFDVKQEDVNAFEVGLKSSGNRLRFELAAFYYDYKNLQVSFTQNVNGVALVILQNAPSAKIHGAEASFDYKVTDNFSIRAGATYLHARYGDNFIFNGQGVNPNAAAFNLDSDPIKNLQNIGLEQDLSGLQMSRAPDFTAFAGFDYLIPAGDGGIRIAANVKYTSSYVVTNPSIWGGWVTNTASPLYSAANVGKNDALLRGTAFADRANEQRARQSAYALVNASITYTDPSGHYYGKIWGNNLTNFKYRTHYNPLSTGTYSPIAEPLSFGGTIGYKF